MTTKSIDIRNILRPILLIAISLTIGIGIGIGIARANSTRFSAHLRGVGELDQRVDLRVVGLHNDGLRDVGELPTLGETLDLATLGSAELRVEDAALVRVLDGRLPV